MYASTYLKLSWKLGSYPIDPTRYLFCHGKLLIGCIFLMSFAIIWCKQLVLWIFRCNGIVKKSVYFFNAVSISVTHLRTLKPQGQKSFHTCFLFLSTFVLTYQMTQFFAHDPYLSYFLCSGGQKCHCK